jgi:hypothetical protein
MKAKTKIKIKTSGFELELTIAEARELRNELNVIFGSPQDTKWAPPIPAFPCPYEPWHQPITSSSESMPPARNK